MDYRISVVIPVYNSEQSLEELYLRLTKVLKTLTCDYEIVMVNDCSRDNSYETMKNLRERDRRVKIISLASNYGQQKATLCGLNYSSGDFVVTLDDDLQNPPEEIHALLKKIQEGYDMVFAVPDHKKHSFYRNMGSILVNICLSLIYHKPLKKRVSSYRIIRREIVKKIVVNPDFIYLTALILNKTLNITSITVRHDRRKYGQSNYNLRKSINLVFNLLVYYSYIPLIFIGFLWLLALMTTVFLGSEGGLKVLTGIKVAGVLTVGIFAVLSFLSLFILSKYRMRSRTEKADDSPYTIKDIQI